MKSQTIEIKERPILFNTEMVKAVLEGRKTQTRRVIKDPYKYFQCADFARTMQSFPVGGEDVLKDKCSYGKPGDRLWVRETWAEVDFAPVDFGGAMQEETRIVYRADFGDEPVDWNWKPSIFMPREACRIQLEITDIRVERVQDISENDAKAEGIQSFWNKQGISVNGIPGLVEPKPNQTWTTKDAFAELWDSINEKRGYGWEVNPWVWVIEFRKI